MIDIGNTLRDARRRQDLGLGECEAATRIRGKYLTALEDERFELLPEAAYARGFLRTYAQFLGLDPGPLLQELEDRLAPGPGEPEPQTLAPVRIRQPRRGRRHRGRMVLVGLGSVGVLAGAVWLGGRGGPGPTLDAGLTGAGVTAAPSRPATTPRARAPVKRSPPPATPSADGELRLAARSSTGSWVQVRRAGPTGPVLFEGTIAQGAARRFSLRTRLWMRVGWGPALRATVAGRAQVLPAGTAEVTVTRAGIAS